MQNSQATPKGLGLIADSLSQLKLSNLFVGLIIFFSATQFGFHFWPLSSLVYGIRIDYLSPTLYFLDILIVLFLGSDLLRKSRAKLGWRSVLKRNSWLQAKKGSAAAERTDLIGTINPIVLINLLYSQNPLATLSWSLHFVLYCAFLSTQFPLGSDLLRKSWPTAKMFSRTTKTSSETRSDPQGVPEILRLSLTPTLLFQLILASIQVYLGHSVGGLMYYLGERSVVVGSPSIALGSFMDSVVLRAYGTFSHPNILAGYSVISFLIILSLVLKRSDLVGCKPNQKPTRSDLVGVIFPLILTTLLILLTQSRSAAISLFGLIIPLYFLKSMKTKLVYYILILFACWFIYPSFLSPSRSDLSASQRLSLQGLSLKLISSYPIFGTGAQASISTYPITSPNFRLLQPDHDSFTLFMSWFGIFGVVALLSGSAPLSKTRTSGLFSRLQNIIRRPGQILKAFLPLLHLLPLLLLDHYLITSPQGLFILVIYFTIALNYSHAQKNT